LSCIKIADVINFLFFKFKESGEPPPLNEINGPPESRPATPSSLTDNEKDLSASTNSKSTRNNQRLIGTRSSFRGKSVNIDERNDEENAEQTKDIRIKEEPVSEPEEEEHFKRTAKIKAGYCIRKLAEHERTVSDTIGEDLGTPATAKTVATTTIKLSPTFQSFRANTQVQPTLVPSTRIPVTSLSQQQQRQTSPAATPASSLSPPESIGDLPVDPQFERIVSRFKKWINNQQKDILTLCIKTVAKNILLSRQFSEEAVKLETDKWLHERIMKTFGKQYLHLILSHQTLKWIIEHLVIKVKSAVNHIIETYYSDISHQRRPVTTADSTNTTRHPPLPPPLPPISSPLSGTSSVQSATSSLPSSNTITTKTITQPNNCQTFVNHPPPAPIMSSRLSQGTPSRHTIPPIPMIFNDIQRNRMNAPPLSVFQQQFQHMSAIGIPVFRNEHMATQRNAVATNQLRPVNLHPVPIAVDFDDRSRGMPNNLQQPSQPQPQQFQGTRNQPNSNANTMLNNISINVNYPRMNSVQQQQHKQMVPRFLQMPNYQRVGNVNPEQITQLNSQQLRQLNNTLNQQQRLPVQQQQVPSASIGQRLPLPPRAALNTNPIRSSNLQNLQNMINYRLPPTNQQQHNQQQQLLSQRPFSPSPPAGSSRMPLSPPVNQPRLTHPASSPQFSLRMMLSHNQQAAAHMQQLFHKSTIRPTQLLNMNAPPSQSIAQQQQQQRQQLQQRKQQQTTLDINIQHNLIGDRASTSAQSIVQQQQQIQQLLRHPQQQQQQVRNFPHPIPVLAQQQQQQQQQLSRNTNRSSIIGPGQLNFGKLHSFHIQNNNKASTLPPSQSTSPQQTQGTVSSGGIAANGFTTSSPREPPLNHMQSTGLTAATNTPILTSSTDTIFNKPRPLQKVSTTEASTTDNQAPGPRVKHTTPKPARKRYIPMKSFKGHASASSSNSSQFEAGESTPVFSMDDFSIPSIPPIDLANVFGDDIEGVMDIETPETPPQAPEQIDNTDTITPVSDQEDIENATVSEDKANTSPPPLVPTADIDDSAELSFAEPTEESCDVPNLELDTVESESESILPSNKVNKPSTQSPDNSQQTLSLSSSNKSYEKSPQNLSQEVNTATEVTKTTTTTTAVTSTSTSTTTPIDATQNKGIDIQPEGSPEIAIVDSIPPTKTSTKRQSVSFIPEEDVPHKVRKFIQEHYQTITERMANIDNILGHKLNVHIDGSIEIHLVDGESIRIRYKDLVRRKYERESSQATSSNSSEVVDLSCQEESSAISETLDNDEPNVVPETKPESSPKNLTQEAVVGNRAKPIEIGVDTINGTDLEFEFGGNNNDAIIDKNTNENIDKCVESEKGKENHESSTSNNELCEKAYEIPATSKSPDDVVDELHNYPVTKDDIFLTAEAAAEAIGNALNSDDSTPSPRDSQTPYESPSTPAPIPSYTLTSPAACIDEIMNSLDFNFGESALDSMSINNPFTPETKGECFTSAWEPSLDAGQTPTKGEKIDTEKDIQSNTSQMVIADETTERQQQPKPHDKEGSQSKSDETFDCQPEQKTDRKPTLKSSPVLKRFKNLPFL